MPGVDYYPKLINMDINTLTKNNILMPVPKDNYTSLKIIPLTCFFFFLTTYFPTKSESIICLAYVSTALLYQDRVLARLKSFKISSI